MLYVVATPIGNIQDFSQRAIEVLQQSDYILCEDTRHSRVLMQRYDISTPLHSFHKFKEAESQQQVIEDLKAGRQIALISDAGTPLISDPGESLIARCRQEEIAVSTVPGPCAVIAALSISGFPTAPFQFLGFLPKKEMQLQQMLATTLLYPGTSVAYEAPHRILETLEVLRRLAPQRTLCVARELTKMHEECVLGTAAELLAQVKPRGEIVLLISPHTETRSFDDMSLKELVAYLQEELGLNKSESIKLAAEIAGLSKREVYRKFFNTE